VKSKKSSRQQRIVHQKSSLRNYAAVAAAAKAAEAGKLIKQVYID